MDRDKKDMTLSEFIGRTRVEDNKDGSYSVTFKLFTGQDTTVKILDCTSEFDANERCFMYLKAMIHKK